MSNIASNKEKSFDTKNALWPFLKRIFTYAYRHKKFFWGFLICVIAIAIFDAIWPLLWMSFIDLAIVPGIEAYKASQVENFTPDYSNVYYYGGLFAINGICSVIAVIGFIWCTGNIKELVLMELRKEMFIKLQGLSFSFFDKSQSGWLLSRITSDAQKVSRLISWGFLNLVWGITMIVACLISMFYYQWKLAAIVTLSLPLLMVLSIKIRTMIMKYSRDSRRINSDIISAFTENINGVAVNKATSQEKRVGRNFNLLADDMAKVTFKAGYFTVMYQPLIIFIGSITAIFVIFFGGQMVLSGLTLGVFIAFFRYAVRIFEPVMDISSFYSFAQSSLSAGERIFSLLDEEVAIKDDASVKEHYNNLNGDIEFANVTFGYNAENTVLENFNLTVEAGQSIAIVGPTGEGKSTIVNLISRFYEPTDGAILIDGINYKKRTLNSLRSQLGIVLQSPHLFSGTIRDNVAYGNPTASLEEIKEALKTVAADEMIPYLDKEVGESGTHLSTGERQLVSFARAVLANPSILIMDEATSSIDTLAEAKIQKAIKGLLSKRTAFIIAHRLSTIKNCDRILVINQGSIVEDGSHENLMALGGKYYDLYSKQKVHVDV